MEFTVKEDWEPLMGWSVILCPSTSNRSSLTFTVLPLSVIRGLVVVLVKVEPSITRKKSSAIVNVLPESLTSGPARVTVAAPVTVLPELSSTRKKLSPGSPPSDSTVSDPMLKVLFVNWNSAVVPVPVKVAS